jgi:hypothetical protein
MATEALHFLSSQYNEKVQISTLGRRARSRNSQVLAERQVSKKLLSETAERSHPRVPDLKKRVVSLSPTLAGRVLTS